MADPIGVQPKDPGFCHGYLGHPTSNIRSTRTDPGLNGRRTCYEDTPTATHVLQVEFALFLKEHGPPHVFRKVFFHFHVSASECNIPRKGVLSNLPGDCTNAWEAKTAWKVAV